MSENDKNAKDKCSFCGGDFASAVWNNVIFCCRTCALETLPKLMADAIVGGTHKQQIKFLQGGTCSITQETIILKNFYSAFSSALIRKWRDAPSFEEMNQKYLEEAKNHITSR